MDENSVEGTLKSTSREYQSLADVVYNDLKTAIVSGSLRPESRLSDRDIARTMEVSTTTVKRALHKLHSEGLVEIRPRRGTFVVDLSDVSIEENSLLRAAVEGTASRIAARKAQQDDIVDLTDLLAEMKQATEGFHLEKLIELNTRFHNRIHDIARNQYLKQLIDVLRSFDLHLRKTVLTDQHEAIRSFSEHRAIVEAIANHDQQAAEERTRNHMMRTNQMEPE